MKFSEESFIYPYTEEEEKEILHNTEKKMAYDAGKESGIEQNNKEKAKIMREKGIDINLIVEITGLSKDEIDKL